VHPAILHSLASGCRPNNRVAVAGGGGPEHPRSRSCAMRTWPASHLRKIVPT